MVEGITRIACPLPAPASPSPRGPPQTRPPACSTDLDIVGDGKIFLNDGTGFFSKDDRTNAGSQAMFGAMFGDVNGDGYVDFMTGCQLYINDGSGAFSLYTPPTIRSNNHAHSDWDFFFTPFTRTSKTCGGSAIGDIDNDGDLDFVIVYPGVMLGEIDAIFRK